MLLTKFNYYFSHMNQWLSTFEEILKTLISPLEWIMLFAIVGGGLFLTFQSKGYPF